MRFIEGHTNYLHLTNKLHLNHIWIFDCTTELGESLYSPERHGVERARAFDSKVHSVIYRRNRARDLRRTDEPWQGKREGQAEEWHDEKLRDARMRNWQVIFYIRRDNSFDFPAGSRVGMAISLSARAPRATLYYGNFIRDTRRWYPQSAFDSHRNKLQFDLGREREGGRERRKRPNTWSHGREQNADRHYVTLELPGFAPMQIDILGKCNWLRNSAELHRKNFDLS